MSQEQKTAHITFRVSPSEKQMIQSDAKSRGLIPSDHARDLLISQYSKQKDSRESF
jgi:hypothetical protein